MSIEAALEIGRLYKPISDIASFLTSKREDIFIQLPGIIAYYPMSVTGITGLAENHAAGGSGLSLVGVSQVGYDGNSFRTVGTGASYLTGGAIHGITGTETWIQSALRGLTIGGWFKVNVSPGVAGGAISRDAPGPQRGYSLTWGATNNVSMSVSATGSGVVTASLTSVSLSEWHFLVGRFIPSTEVAVMVDGQKVVNTTGVPASVFVSSQGFEIGRYFNNNSRTLDCSVRDVFICQAAISDDILEALRLGSAP